MMNLPELGVGIIFFPGLEPLLETGENLIDVVEVEPQAFWFTSEGDEERYRSDQRILPYLDSLPQHKLIHGVGLPVGGVLPLEYQQLAPFVETIKAVGAPWATEHLSFIRVGDANGQFNTGFMLPPLQSEEYARIAADKIRELSFHLPVPFAFETGVNYLRPQRGELTEGQFFRTIAEQSESGILLDLHNLWCNQLNGRQKVLDVLDELPLDRVWEIHLAGGRNFNGYWLDAHSGLVPEDLMELAAQIMPRLPNLKTMIFELIPDYIEYSNLQTKELLNQIVGMRRLWEKRNRNNNRGEKPAFKNVSPQAIDASDLPRPAEWEESLGRLVIGQEPSKTLEFQLSLDPGIEVLRMLVTGMRAGMIVELLRLSHRYIQLHSGDQRFNEMLSSFWNSEPPEMVATKEAINFAEYLMKSSHGIPHLNEVLDYELATHRVLIEKTPRTVRFGCDPLALLSALGEGRLPDKPTEGEFHLQINP